MATLLGNLVAKIGVDNTDLIRGLNKADKSFDTFTSKSIKGVKGITSSVFSLKTAIVGLASSYALKKISSDFVETASSVQKMRISLDTITKGKGVEWFAKLNKWAAQMPVNTEKAIKSFTMMRAMGLEPTIKDMTTLVDTTSALGGSEDVLSAIARALGQMQAKGKPAAEEIMQLAERGVPAMEILKDKLNLTEKEIANLGGSGIKAAEAIEALLEGMEERFGGQSAKIMNTWSGMIETMKQGWFDLKKDIADAGVWAAMEYGLGQLIGKFDELRANTDRYNKFIVGISKVVIKAIAGMIRAVGNLSVVFVEVKQIAHNTFAFILIMVKNVVDAMEKLKTFSTKSFYTFAATSAAQEGNYELVEQMLAQREAAKENVSVLTDLSKWLDKVIEGQIDAGISTEDWKLKMKAFQAETEAAAKGIEAFVEKVEEAVKSSKNIGSTETFLDVDSSSSFKGITEQVISSIVSPKLEGFGKQVQEAMFPEPILMEFKPDLNNYEEWADIHEHYMERIHNITADAFENIFTAGSFREAVKEGFNFVGEIWSEVTARMNADLVDKLADAIGKITDKLSSSISNLFGGGIFGDIAGALGGGLIGSAIDSIGDFVSGLFGGSKNKRLKFGDLSFKYGDTDFGNISNLSETLSFKGTQIEERLMSEGQAIFDAVENYLIQLPEDVQNSVRNRLESIDISAGIEGMIINSKTWGEDLTNAVVEFNESIWSQITPILEEGSAELDKYYAEQQRLLTLPVEQEKILESLERTYKKTIGTATDLDIAIWNVNDTFGSFEEKMAELFGRDSQEYLDFLDKWQEAIDSTVDSINEASKAQNNYNETLSDRVTLAMLKSSITGGDVSVFGRFATKYNWAETGYMANGQYNWNVIGEAISGITSYTTEEFNDLAESLGLSFSELSGDFNELIDAITDVTDSIRENAESMAQSYHAFSKSITDDILKMETTSASPLSSMDQLQKAYKAAIDFQGGGSFGSVWNSLSSDSDRLTALEDARTLWNNVLSVAQGALQRPSTEYQYYYGQVYEHLLDLKSYSDRIATDYDLQVDQLSALEGIQANTDYLASNGIVVTVEGVGIATETTSTGIGDTTSNIGSTIPEGVYAHSQWVEDLVAQQKAVEAASAYYYSAFNANKFGFATYTQDELNALWEAFQNAQSAYDSLVAQEPDNSYRFGGFVDHDQIAKLHSPEWVMTPNDINDLINNVANEIGGGDVNLVIHAGNLDPKEIADEVRKVLPYALRVGKSRRQQIRNVRQF